MMFEREGMDIYHCYDRSVITPSVRPSDPLWQSQLTAHILYILTAFIAHHCSSSSNSKIARWSSSKVEGTTVATYFSTSLTAGSLQDKRVPPGPFFPLFPSLLAAYPFVPPRSPPIYFHLKTDLPESTHQLTHISYIYHQNRPTNPVTQYPLVLFLFIQLIVFHSGTIFGLCSSVLFIFCNLHSPDDVNRKGGQLMGTMKNWMAL